MRGTTRTEASSKSTSECKSTPASTGTRSLVTQRLSCLTWLILLKRQSNDWRLNVRGKYLTYLEAFNEAMRLANPKKGMPRVRVEIRLMQDRFISWYELVEVA